MGRMGLMVKTGRKHWHQIFLADIFDTLLHSFYTLLKCHQCTITIPPTRVPCPKPTRRYAVSFHKVVCMSKLHSPALDYGLQPQNEDNAGHVSLGQMKCDVLCRAGSRKDEISSKSCDVHELSSLMSPVPAEWNQLRIWRDVHLFRTSEWY